MSFEQYYTVLMLFFGVVVIALGYVAWFITRKEKQ
jgi:hypothetical protein